MVIASKPRWRCACSGFDVRKLVVLSEVARAGSITAAARNLSYTRSALSQQLSSLEADAGVRLLDRARGRAVLTEAGRTLVEHTEHVLVELRRAGESVTRRTDEVCGRLRVGAPFREGPQLMGTALAEVRRRYPRVEVALSAVTDASGDEAVRSGRLDAALSSVHGDRPVSAVGDLARTVLAEDPLELCLPRDHRLAAQERCTLADLAHERWVVPTGSALGPCCSPPPAAPASSRTSRPRSTTSAPRPRWWAWGGWSRSCPRRPRPTQRPPWSAGPWTTSRSRGASWSRCASPGVVEPA